jgi:hypothetical protein
MIPELCRTICCKQILNKNILSHRARLIIQELLHVEKLFVLADVLHLTKYPLLAITHNVNIVQVFNGFSSTLCVPEFQVINARVNYAHGKLPALKSGPIKGANRAADLQLKNRKTEDAKLNNLQPLDYFCSK